MKGASSRRRLRGRIRAASMVAQAVKSETKGGTRSTASPMLAAKSLLAESRSVLQDAPQVSRFHGMVSIGLFRRDNYSVCGRIQTKSSLKEWLPLGPVSLHSAANHRRLVPRSDWPSRSVSLLFLIMVDLAPRPLGILSYCNSVPGDRCRGTLSGNSPHRRTNRRRGSPGPHP